MSRQDPSWTEEIALIDERFVGGETAWTRDDVDMLVDLVVAAISQGIDKAKELAREELLKLTGGFNIPGLIP